MKHVASDLRVYDLIKEPTEDQIDTLDLLKLMRTRREEMEFDFEQFEALCYKTHGEHCLQGPGGELFPRSEQFERRNASL